MPVTRVEPSTKLFDTARTFRYTNAANTDISKRFKAMQAKAMCLWRKPTNPMEALPNIIRKSRLSPIPKLTILTIMERRKTIGRLS